MSRQSVKKAELTNTENVVLAACALMVGELLGGAVSAFMLVDDNGVFVAPVPGGEKEVMQLLANCDWAKMIRHAEEWTA